VPAATLEEDDELVLWDDVVAALVEAEVDPAPPVPSPESSPHDKAVNVARVVEASRRVDREVMVAPKPS